MADLLAISQSDAGGLQVESKPMSGKCLRNYVETEKYGVIAIETIRMRNQRPAPFYE